MALCKENLQDEKLNITMDPKPMKTTEEIRDALTMWLKNNNKPVDEIDGITFTKVQSYNAHYYVLKTLTETREETKAVTAYDKYVLVDGECYGPSPPIWSIDLSPPTAFVSGSSEFKKKIHTDVVKSCSNCTGKGYHFFSSDNRCTSCNGTGCLVHFWRFRAYYRVHVYDHVTYLPAGLSKEKMIKSGSKILLNETSTRVSPVTIDQVNDPELINFSKLQVGKKYPECRILLQEQIVERIPVTIVEYKSHRKSGKFYLYGTFNEIHFAKSNVCVIS